MIVGAFYLIFGLTLALTREGFDLTEHALSLLTLGDYGWLQTMNLLLSGIMVVVAAVGFRRALGDSGAGTKVAYLIGVYGACLIASAIFGPDPANDFPTPTASTDPTMSGILHLAFGAIGFLGLAAAAFIFARCSRSAATPAPRAAPGLPRGRSESHSSPAPPCPPGRSACCSCGSPS